MRELLAHFSVSKTADNSPRTLEDTSEESRTDDLRLVKKKYKLENTIIVMLRKLREGFAKQKHNTINFAPAPRPLKGPEIFV